MARGGGGRGGDGERVDYGTKQVRRGTKISSFSFRKIECDVGMYSHFHDRYENSCYRSMAMQVRSIAGSNQAWNVMKFRDEVYKIVLRFA